AVGVDARGLAWIQLEHAGGEMLGAGVEALEHPERAAPDRLGLQQRAPLRLRPWQSAAQRLVAAAPLRPLELRPRARIGARRPRAGRRRVELQHAKLLVAMRVHVVPRVT